MRQATDAPISALGNEPRHESQLPSLWVVRFCALMAPGGRALDIACGRGRHARLLASRGLQVTAVDRDPAALAAMHGVPGIEPLAADLEAAPWPFAPASFDAIVITNYLHRALFGPILRTLRGGGLLLYETFMAGQERFGRPSNPDFLLQPHELLSAFATLHVIAFEQGLEQGVQPRVVQRIAASSSERTDAWPLPSAVRDKTGSGICETPFNAACN